MTKSFKPNRTYLCINGDDLFTVGLTYRSILSEQLRDNQVPADKIFDSVGLDGRIFILDNEEDWIDAIQYLDIDQFMDITNCPVLLELFT